MVTRNIHRKAYILKSQPNAGWLNIVEMDKPNHNKLSKLYKKNGIDNAYKLKNISNTWVKKSPNVLGAKTVMELRGISCNDLETEATKRKSCCVSRSFGKRVESLEKKFSLKNIPNM